MRHFYLYIFLVLAAIILLFVFLPFKSPFAVKNNNENSSFIPTNRINGTQIEIKNDRIIIHINNAVINQYANTSSMMPIINENANSIEIVPENPEQIHEGDIITFEQGNLLIVHRVIETGYDEKGWYAITKGDNSQGNDGKIRFEQIKYVTIGILY